MNCSNVPTPPPQAPTRRRIRGGLRQMGPSTRANLRQVMEEASYEILPFAGVADRVLAHVPRTVRLTVTTTQAKGLDRTVDVAVALACEGYRSAPHLAARLVRNEQHLRDLVGRLDDAGVDGVFVIGGDAPEPAGEYRDALSLLVALEEVGHRFTRVGIGGYPEGHGHIPDATMDQALVDKARHATLVITQMCFSPQRMLTWAESVQLRGVNVPIRVGIPGVVSRQRLIRVSAGLGLGQSARFLQKQQGMLWRFLLPNGYSPDPLVTGLADGFGASATGLRGLHVFTFNELDRTEAWRQEWLRRLG